MGAEGDGVVLSASTDLHILVVVRERCVDVVTGLPT
jgi:hypothetical protein